MLAVGFEGILQPFLEARQSMQAAQMQCYTQIPILQILQSISTEAAIPVIGESGEAALWLRASEAVLAVGAVKSRSCAQDRLPLRLASCAPPQGFLPADCSYKFTNAARDLIKPDEGC